MEKAEAIHTRSTAEKYCPASMSPWRTRLHELNDAWWVEKKPAKKTHESLRKPCVTRPTRTDSSVLGVSTQVERRLHSFRVTWWVVKTPLKFAAAQNPPQTLGGSFSAVSKPRFARKYAFESSPRDLHNALLFAQV